ncbi:MAG: hypothetical protein GXP59_00135 [Deltaproteobacteria bacterium]|nr:hypothetical protein [Deltaproteobacteria bacterium]
MDFSSFEQALQICMTSAEGSPEQDKAILYCLEFAPDEIKEKLRDIMRHQMPVHGHDCGCGCKHGHK